MNDLKSANAKRWEAARLIRRAEAVAVAKSLIAAKQRYLTVALKTGVPWFVIACIHERESAQNWNSQLAQGDPLNQPSVHVPRGMGPYPSWEAGAIDALMNCKPYIGHNRDWSIVGMLEQLELYNGLGYFNRGLPSPYVWAGTDQYASGKFVADGVFSGTAVDKQLGCAALLIAMMALDRTIFVGTPPIILSPVPDPLPPDVPKMGTPKPASGWSAFFAAIIAIFKRK